MNQYSRRSLAHLLTCHPLLVQLFEAVLEEADHTVICGHRGKIDQEAALASRASRAKWGQSNHNFYPSLAVDVMPWPLDWNDMERLNAFSLVVRKHANRLGIKARWGADWDQDGIPWEKDNWEIDGPHWELVGIKGELP